MSNIVPRVGKIYKVQEPDFMNLMLSDMTFFGGQPIIFRCKVKGQIIDLWVFCQSYVSYKGLKSSYLMAADMVRCAEIANLNRKNCAPKISNRFYRLSISSVCSLKFRFSKI